MLGDFRDSPESLLREPEAEFCIVGAGVAGLTLARRLLGCGKRIVLVESGGLDYEPDIAALNAGENEGLPYYALEDSRLRLFGGTAAIWGGRCAELDEIDFEPREWVRYSGWPFRKSALSSYYREMRRLLGLVEPPAAGQLWSRLGVRPPRFGTGVLTTDLWQFDDAWDRFGSAANRDLTGHPDILVLLHATIVEVHLAESGSVVESIEIASPGGRRTRLRARNFILAAGGMENARILLASRSRIPGGIGNRHDVVGRFFMEHPHARAGRLHLQDVWSALGTFRSSHWLDGHRYAACLRPDERLQRRKHILNSSFTPRVRAHPDGCRDMTVRIYKSIKERAAPTRTIRTLWRSARSASRWLQRAAGPLHSWMQIQTRRKGLYLSVRAEQAPNPASRVRLLDRQDALGVPRIALDWRLSPIDKRTICTLVGELDAQLRRDKAGHVEPAPWLSSPDIPWEHDALVSLHPIGGYHHMGTTRMASDPRFGVVNAHCRVHGIANLFIAGSSVFPTSGWANPTLTIGALALRLADHLRNLASHASVIDRERPLRAQAAGSSQESSVVREARR